jgi:hypothetical protein
MTAATQPGLDRVVYTSAGHYVMLALLQALAQCDPLQKLVAVDKAPSQAAHLLRLPRLRLDLCGQLLKVC